MLDNKEKVRVSAYAIPGLKQEYIDKIDSPGIIIKEVCEYFGVSKARIMSDCKERELADIRHLCMYFIRIRLQTTVTEIGKIFNRDHTSISYAIQKTARMLKDDTDETMFRKHCKHLHLKL